MADTAAVGDLLKTWLDLLRQAVILVLIFLTLLFPKGAGEYVAKFASQLGVDTVKTPLGDINVAKLREVAGGVDTARTRTIENADALRAVSAGAPPEVRKKIEAIASELETTSAALKRPDELLVSAVQAEQKKGDSSQGLTGWVYLGHVTEAKTEWDPQPRSVRAPSPAFKPGETLTVSDDLYVRGDSQSGQRNQAPVLGVVRAGQTVQVLDLQHVHSVRGGWFVWVKVAAT